MRIFVVGNIAMDDTYQVERLPTEGESIFGKKLTSELGGKGANQAVILARAGLPVTFVAGVGTDAQAERIRTRLASEPLEARFLVFEDISTDLSIVLTDGAGGNTIVTTVDCARQMTFPALLPLLEDARTGDLLVLQGNLSLPTTEALFDFAQTRQMRVAFNPSPVAAGLAPLLKCADTLFLNQHEARVLTGREGKEAMQALQALGIATVVLTLGKEGAVLGRGPDQVSVSAVSVEAVDTTGAGDTFQSAAIAAALLKDTEIDEQALELAAKAAAITVSRHGTVSAFPTRQEFATLLRQVAPAPGK